MPPHALDARAPRVDEQVREALHGGGAALVCGALDRALLDMLARAAEERYRWIEELALREGPVGVERRLPSGCRFVATASSLSLGALDESTGLEVACAVASEEPLRRLLAALHGGPFAVDLDQAWLRRQYAPARYPRWHAPHSWHQDGALGYDFAAHAPAAETEPGSLLPVVTCWAPLGPCGRDAPGLELLATRLERLLAPADLAPQALSRRFRGATAWAPEMQPGDVLLIHGGTLHRTHVTPAMTVDRTSIELRVFAAGEIPPRLAGDRFSRSLGGP